MTWIKQQQRDIKLDFALPKVTFEQFSNLIKMRWLKIETESNQCLFYYIFATCDHFNIHISCSAVGFWALNLNPYGSDITILCPEYSWPVSVNGPKSGSTKLVKAGYVGSLFVVSSVHPKLSKSDNFSRKENTYFTSPWNDHVSARMSWFDSLEEISYVTAHVQTIRGPCFKGVAYPWAPLGSSQGKASTVQTDPCIRDNAASALWAQTSELSSLLWKCLCKSADPPSVCVS